MLCVKNVAYQINKYMQNTTILGKVTLTPRGDYNSTTTYNPLDVIMFNGTSWVVLSSFTNISPSLENPHVKVLANSGEVGPKGDTGRTATVSVGTVTSGDSPVITNSGTSTDAVLNFVLAKGDKGDKGDKGESGGVEVIDNLSTQDSTKALSANMGYSIAAALSRNVLLQGDSTAKQRGDNTGVYVEIESSNGFGNNQKASQHSIMNATKTVSGVMSKEDKAKLDGIEANAQVNVPYDDSSIKADVARVEAIAKGGNRAVAFDTAVALDEWLAIPENIETLHVGDHLLIRETNTPDYWWDGTTKVELESGKIDLSEYIKTSDISNDVRDTSTTKPTSANVANSVYRLLEKDTVRKIVGFDADANVVKLTHNYGPTTEQGTETATPLPTASQTKAGVMTAEQVMKLENIESGAQVNKLVVDNLDSSDVERPLSANQGRVLNNKIDYTIVKAMGGVASPTNFVLTKATINFKTQTILDSPITIPAASASTAGVMTATDKVKLDSLGGHFVDMSFLLNGETGIPPTSVTQEQLDTVVYAYNNRIVTALVHMQSFFIQILYDDSMKTYNIRLYNTIMDAKQYTLMCINYTVFVDTKAVTHELFEFDDNRKVVGVSNVSSLSPHVYNQTYVYNATVAREIGFSSIPEDGFECVLSLMALGDKGLVQPLPSGPEWQCEEASVTIPPNKVVEISIRRILGKYIVRL